MADADFYAAYADERLATNLFNGWGYNFYRAENQLRADDLMVRAKVSEMLGAARAAIAAAELAYRQANLPPPSRTNPLPDPHAVRHAQALEAMGQAMGALEGQIRALPVPETDRMTQRLRSERETLERLLAADRTMVSLARLLCDQVTGATPDEILGLAASLTRSMTKLADTLRARRLLLAAPA